MPRKLIPSQTIDFRFSFGHTLIISDKTTKSSHAYKKKKTNTRLYKKVYQTA